MYLFYSRLWNKYSYNLTYFQETKSLRMRELSYHVRATYLDMFM